MKAKNEKLERVLGRIDLSVIDLEISLDRKLRIANVLAQTVFALVLVGVFATICLYLRLYRII
jgi:hypothetical protein